MDNEGHKYSINKGTITCRSDSTKCNISEISRNEGYKKGHMVIIVGSGGSANSDLLERLKMHGEEIKKAMHEMGKAGINAAQAGESLKMAMIKLSELDIKLDPCDFTMPIRCPKEMIMPDMDFSRIETIVMDSLARIGPSYPTKFAGQCYDESGPISKKAYKKLKQLAKKMERKEEKSHKQEQTDRWCNKWDKKIKRKL